MTPFLVPHRFRHLGLGAMLLMAVVALGCGNKTAVVTGKAIYKGKPLTGGLGHVL